MAFSLVVEEGQCYLIPRCSRSIKVAELETLGFNNTLNSFEVDKLGQAKSLLYIAPHNLLDHEILHKWEFNSNTFASVTLHILQLHQIQKSFKVSFLV